MTEGPLGESWGHQESSAGRECFTWLQLDQTVAEQESPSERTEQKEESMSLQTTLWKTEVEQARESWHRMEKALNANSSRFHDNDTRQGISVMQLIIDDGDND